VSRRKIGVTLPISEFFPRLYRESLSSVRCVVDFVTFTNNLRAPLIGYNQKRVN